MKVTTSGSLTPTARIAVKRNVVKHYGDKVYLKNGTHFEIALFNPKTKKICAKIYLDGQLISHSGIVIRPGKTEFIERWIDEPKKFLFETYEVDNTAEAKNAIRDNGRVRVEFYDESGPILPSNPNITYIGNTNWDNQIYGQNIFFCSSVGTSDASQSVNSVSMDSLETGRAEKGENSNQNFINDNSNYEYFHSSVVELQILPDSQKPAEEYKVRNYCTQCGGRVKSPSWKFCPYCREAIS